VFAAAAGASASAKTTVQTALTALTAAEMQGMLVNAGSRHNVDADLLAAVVKAESGGQVRAVSRTGAEGLMQLMPGTAKEQGVADAFRPEQNIAGGTAYLDQLLTRYHDDVALALAAYNAGPAAVDRYHGIPPYRETQAYVARVIREFNRRKQLAIEMAKRDTAHHAVQAAALMTGTR
jgi:soluble lytic murein transglycosylase-like protein